MEAGAAGAAGAVGAAGAGAGAGRAPVIRSTREYLAAAAAEHATSPGSDSAEDRDTPREVRNKAEKQRRDKLNQSIAMLAKLVPPVVRAARRTDKTGVLRLTAHYLRAHQYVFGDSTGRRADFSVASVMAVLDMMKGFLITTTYKGLVVVVSPNVQKYLGYSELDLLGQNIATIIHKDDVAMLKEQLMPQASLLGPSGELLVPEDAAAMEQLKDTLANDKKRFVIRFKKLTQRSEPVQYVVCHVEGSMRKADRACRGYNRCCQMVRRARSRCESPTCSGNDVVFVGMVRPSADTILMEKGIEASNMEYRTRHSIDGEIIQCDQKISLVAGYMTHEVQGLNALAFMHRDDVRWVVIALRETESHTKKWMSLKLQDLVTDTEPFVRNIKVYDQQSMVGESSYRLMGKNGEFIYMRTRGHLEVNPITGEAKTFVCTNTNIGEAEWRELIQNMKKRYTNIHSETVEPPTYPDDEEVSVEDPESLQEVILQMVTNLPQPPPREPSPLGSPHAQAHISHIPNERERIVQSIGKIYDILNIPFTRSRPTSSNVKIVELPDETYPLPIPYQENKPMNQLMQYQNPEYQSMEYQKPYQMLEHQKPYQMLEHQKPYQMLEHQKPYQMLEHQKPYQMLEHQKPYQMLEYPSSPEMPNAYKATAVKCPVKITDQVLAAVQLQPASSPALVAKRATEPEEEDAGVARKKLRDLSQNQFENDEPQLSQEVCDRVAEILEGSGLEAQLEDTLNSMQNVGGTGEYEDFPDILKFFNFEGDQNGDDMPNF